ncbi:alpha/beta hydrolase [Antarcticibacterium arcticum]|uniref:Alpha/beta hydrolase n=2 Tax=Antarcticibacterium arcticum TaxID=2585771 RepID=A0A5B8YP93_9FLAO|nr:alpha/beta hydrolase [Antarcticibacterium arcticum]
MAGFSQSTASSNVSIIKVYSSQLETEKNIWIYLPASYQSSTQKNYPVLYLQDAQNLFDKSTSYAGEWRVDETLDSLNLDMIVVGIEHGNAKRIDELTPYAHPEHKGGNADNYLNFITKTLKPYIDSQYRTKPAAASTFIGGSSLGGLFAFYSILKHPEIFSKAMVFSPSFWFSEEIFTLARNINMEELSSTKIFFRAGHKESETMVPLMMQMRQILIDNGISMCDVNSKAVFEGTHSEKFWASQFPEAALWLISN